MEGLLSTGPTPSSFWTSSGTRLKSGKGLLKGNGEEEGAEGGEEVEALVN